METRGRDIALPGLLLLVVALLVAWMPARQTFTKTKWLISESSSLRVNGSTNVNTFGCDISGYDRVDTLVVTEMNKVVRLAGDLHLDLQRFDCHNPLMTRDFRKTLKAQQYPTLTITFLSLNSFPVLSKKAEQVTGCVDIELAGVRKRVEVTYQISPADGNRNILLVGQREIKFSDFKLTPPTKFKGMAQTNETLTITFRLKLEPLVNRLAAR